MNYPKDPDENLRWRAKLLRRAAIDPLFKVKLIELFHSDILFAFNAFFYTLDVRKRPFHHLPFCTYPYQDEAILDIQKAISEGSDRVYEKTRDMGVTWMVLGVFFHEWMNRDGGGDFLLGSRIEDYVDKKGDPRTHFEKIRYLLRRLPKFIRPKGFNPRLHDTFMKLVNPQTGSTIGGESNNPNFSTQGRYAAILYDEFAKWESSDVAAWTAGGDASPCRIAVSTSFGASGQFYSLVTNGRTKKLTLHWKLHPEKAWGISGIWPAPNEGTRGQLGEAWRPEEKLTSPWYQKECERRTALEIAQELDIDYLGAGNPVFDGVAWEGLRIYSKIPEKVRKYGKIVIENLKIEWISEPLDAEGFLLVFEEFSSDKTYSIGVDVVEGREDGDYAEIIVYDRSDKSVSAHYFSKLDEVTLARVVYTVSNVFSPEEDSYDSPWCGIETTGPGLATFDKAVELGVNNLFMAPRYDITKSGISYKKGWRTDTQSRNELISGIRTWLIDRAGRLNSQRLCGQLMTFVRSRTGKPIAKSGCYDDAVIAFGIAIQVDELAPRDEEKKEIRNASIDDYTRFKLESLKVDVEEDNSIEARCLNTVLEKKQPIYDDAYWGDL